MSKTVMAILISAAMLTAAVPACAIVTWQDETAPKALISDTDTAGQTGRLGVSAYRAAAERATQSPSR
jgi:hypothetical protein